MVTDGVESAADEEEGTRDKLVRVAATLLEEQGRSAVTLRALGAGAGVSRSAPYRHFASKDALLAAIAARALRSLASELEAALTAARTGSAQAGPAMLLDAMGRAYLQYAHAHPEQYALIYSREVAEVDDPDVGAAAAAAYDLFVGSVAQAADAGLLPPGDPRPFAAVMLATAHGVAGLAGAGHFDSGKWGLEEQDVARLLLSMVVGGVGGRGPDPAGRTAAVSPAAD